MANFSFEYLSFSADWHQEEAGLIRKFIFNFYPCDETVEMFDSRSHKTFLKRVHVPNLTEKCLYIGAKVNVFGRQVILTDYENEWTRTKLSSHRQMGFALISSKSLKSLGEIMEILCSNELSINNCLMIECDKQEISKIIDCFIDSNDDMDLCDILCCGPIVVIQLTGFNVINRLKTLILGPDATTHKDEVHFGNGAATKSLITTHDTETAKKANEYFFSKNSKFTLCKSFENTTLALIKPHAMLEGKTGEILSEITRNEFQIKAMKMFNLTREHCEEFYEVYNGVVAAFSQMVIELSSGPFLAIEIGHRDELKHAYDDFRKLCGPVDPDVARKIRPKTIRAKFGVNSIQNAIHCTDLQEDCLLEIEYFFKILSSNLH